jgi:hypothetical protein
MVARAKGEVHSMSKQSGHHTDWVAEAKKLSAKNVGPPGLPIHVLTGEAVDAAKFVGKYWHSERDPKSKVVTRPGLDLAGGPKRLSPGIGDELMALQDEVSRAQARYLLASGHTADGAPVDRAHFVLGEITATLEWLFDDGVQDQNDEQLAAVEGAHHDDPATIDALAGALDDFRALAEQHREEMDGLGGFDVKLIDEAANLAAELRAHPTTPGASTGSEEARTALDMRNRVATLLLERMGRVRGAARFVFRNHASIAQEATSVYERRRRAAARRAAAKKKQAAEATKSA